MAKTTGKISGNIRMLYMDNVLVGCTTANGFSGTNEQIETTCKDGTNPPPRTYESGAQDASFTGDMIVRFDDANQYSASPMVLYPSFLFPGYKPASDFSERPFFTSSDRLFEYWRAIAIRISHWNIS